MTESPSLFYTVRSNYPYYAGIKRFTTDGDPQKHNALLFTQIMRANGWTDNAIGGLLGNLQGESSINPHAYYGYVAYSGVSFGLVQWDPTSKYETWADANGYLPYYDFEYQCEKIHTDLASGGGGQYLCRDYGNYKPYYHIKAKDFYKSTETPGFLGKTWCYNYERPEWVAYPDRFTASEIASYEKAREDAANKWYAYITGSAPPPDTPDIPNPPTPTPGTSKRMSKLLLFAIGSDLT